MASEGGIRTAVLIPTYDNARTLGEVAEGALIEVPDVLVVDDGSTDDTAAVLDRLAGRVRLHRHPRNRGKGAALRAGFRLLLEAGFTHAITLDSDGQLFPDDIPRFLEAIEADPRALVIGERDLRAAGAPGRSRLGLWFSNRAVRIACGRTLRDTQTGFRAYPLREIAALDLRGNRFDLELEVLVKACWRGLPIAVVPIQVSYRPAGGRITHFRPLRDFLHIALRLGKLLLARAAG